MIEFFTIELKKTASCYFLPFEVFDIFGYDANVKFLIKHQTMPKRLAVDNIHIHMVYKVLLSFKNIFLGYRALKKKQCYINGIPCIG